MATFADSSVQTVLTSTKIRGNDMRAPGFQGFCASCGSRTRPDEDGNINIKHLSLTTQVARRAADLPAAQQRVSLAADGEFAILNTGTGTHFWDVFSIFRTHILTS